LTRIVDSTKKLKGIKALGKILQIAAEDRQTLLNISKKEFKEKRDNIIRDNYDLELLQ